VVATLALLGLAYWLLERDRWVLCGVAMAAAFCFKPQDALLVPIALLVSGRWRPVAVFAGVGAVIALVAAASLGQSGIAAWLNDLSIIRLDPSNAPLTYSFLFGRNAVAAAVEVALGLAALALAWRNRKRLDLVFCLGISGTIASGTYLHEFDVALLVLGAWIMLRSRPSVAQRLTLLAGLVPAQILALGQPIPMLLWEPVWLVALGLEPWLQAREAKTAVRHQPSDVLALGSTRR
jgi:hypothetical protein